MAFKPVSECTSVLELLADPARWCQGHMAVDKNGDQVRARNPEACQWCLMGAVSFIAGDDNDLYHVKMNKLRAVIRSITDGDYLTLYNDRPTTHHADIMAVLEKADI